MFNYFEKRKYHYLNIVNYLNFVICVFFALNLQPNRTMCNVQCTYYIIYIKYYLYYSIYSLLLIPIVLHITF